MNNIPLFKTKHNFFKTLLLHQPFLNGATEILPSELLLVFQHLKKRFFNSLYSIPLTKIKALLNQKESTKIEQHKKHKQIALPNP